MKNYTQQVNEFASKHGIKLSIIGEPAYKRYFSGDKQSRYVFKLKLTRNRKSYCFEFGQSIAGGSQEPTMYDVLTCLTKSNPESFEYFCDEFGYETFDYNTGKQNKTSLKIYKAVKKEWLAVEKLFGDILDELSEIN